MMEEEQTLREYIADKVPPAVVREGVCNRSSPSETPEPGESPQPSEASPKMDDHKHPLHKHPYLLSFDFSPQPKNQLGLRLTFRLGMSLHFGERQVPIGEKDSVVFALKGGKLRLRVENGQFSPKRSSSPLFQDFREGQVQLLTENGDSRLGVSWIFNTGRSRMTHFMGHYGTRSIGQVSKRSGMSCRLRANFQIEVLDVVIKSLEMEGFLQANKKIQKTIERTLINDCFEPELGEHKYLSEVFFDL